MSIERSKAIVLKNQDLRETSVLATFFTKDFGKISGIMKGIRGTFNQTNNSLELFSLSEIIFSILTLVPCTLIGSSIKPANSQFFTVIKPLQFETCKPSSPPPKYLFLFLLQI